MEASNDVGNEQRGILKDRVRKYLERMYHWLAELKEFRFEPDGKEYRTARKCADQCQAQWKAFHMAIKQFYGISYYFNRSNEYFGVSTEDETDWLFKVEREV